jgi:RsmE family RNA methyltransferase
MNLLLLEPTDFTSDNIACIKDERLTHIQKVLGSSIGDTLCVGLINGKCGNAAITSLDNTQATLDTTLDKSPPAPLPLTVILALPRPKMLRRILRNVAEFGIKELYLINSYKVEKSYWSTPALAEEKIHSYLKEGLSQAKDTIMPTVHLKKRFKPFVEDELASIIANKEAFVAHPYNASNMPEACANERVIIIGPEGGFIDYEINLLAQQGVKPISMGERIYKVENALTLLSSQLSTTIL